MRRLAIAAILSVLLTGPALADTFVWQDPKGDFSVSFPDVWRVQTEDRPYTNVRVAGPIGEDMATCKVSVRPDGRALIYRKGLVDEAVVEKLGRDFWERQVGELTDAVITEYHAPASFGDKGDATAIRVGFVQNDGKGMMVPMYGIMIASLYGDKMYLTACSSKHEQWARYSPLFGSIMDSIMLENRDHIYPTGYYRNFLADPKLVLPRSKPGTTKEGQPFWRHWFSRDKYHYE